ncbi:unnamed protein product, partial [marine sediment metagenome]
KAKGTNKLTDGEDLASITDEGYQDVSIHGSHDGDSISFEEDDIDVTTGYVLIDLSDTTNYPHSGTERVGVDWIVVTGLADTSAVGYFDIGFITRIDGVNSDWYSIFHDHFDKKEERFEIMLNLVPQSVECNPTKHLSGGGMKFVNDATFNTGGTVKGTYSDTTPPAVGDLVLKVTRSAGQTDLAVAVGYHTH